MHRVLARLLTTVAVSSVFVVACAMPALALAGGITGSVRDTRGMEIVGAEVAVYADSATDPDGYECVDATTSVSAGVYRLSGLSAGTYRLCVLAMGETFGDTWNGGYSYYTADPTTVSSAGTITVNFEVEKNGSVTGRVTDSLGAPVSGALVKALLSSDPEDLLNTSHWALTNASGYYAVNGLMPYEDYYLMCSSVGFGAQYYDDPLDGLVEPGLFYAGPGAVVTKNFSLARFASIAGTVTANGLPLEDAGIGLFRLSDTSEWLEVPNESFTDTEGAYLATDLEAGFYKVLFSPPWGSAIPEKYYGGGTLSAATTITLASTQQLVGISADLGSAPQTATVTGKITNLVGTGLGGVTVSAYITARGESALVATATTLASGVYTLRDLAPFPYTLQVSGAGRPEQWVSFESSLAPAVIHAASGQTTTVPDFPMRVGLALSGTVSVPAGADDSTATRLATLYDVSTDASGTRRYSLSQIAQCTAGAYSLTGIMPGDYVLEFSADDRRLSPTYWNGASTIASATLITSSTDTTLTGRNGTLALKGSLSGRVYSEDGTALAGITVSTFGPDSETTITKAGGIYRFDYLTAGDYVVEFLDATNHYAATRYVAPSAETSCTTIRVSNATETPSIDGTMPLSATISGLVRGGIADLPNVTVMLMSIDASGEAIAVDSALTDSFGRYSFWGVAPGLYTLRFVPSFTSGFVPAYYGGFSEAPGSAFTISRCQQWAGEDAVLSTGGSISGAVWDSSGAPLVGATIEVIGPDSSRETTSDDSGHYELLGLSAGSYSFAVSPPDGADIATLNSANRIYRELTLEDAGVVPSCDFTFPLASSLSGRVVDEDSTPVAQATVSLYAVFGAVAPPWGATYAAQEVTRATGLDGAYTLTGLAPGYYKVRIEPTSTALAPRFVGGITMDESTVVTITAGSDVPLGDCVLFGGLRLSGRVLDGAASPITGVKVTVEAYRKTGSQYLLAGSVNSTLSGGFAFDALEPGVYVLRALAPAHVTAWLGGGLFPEQATPVTLTADPVDVGALTLPEVPLTVWVDELQVASAEVTLTVGEARQMTATVLPADATDPSTTWTSADAGVVSIDPAGMLTAMAAGETTVTVTALDGTETSATVQVKVIEIPDAEGPTTTCATQPSYTGTATISITASDAVSGVARVLYKLDEETTVAVAGDAATLGVAALGGHRLEAWAVDNRGNEGPAIVRQFDVVDNTMLAISVSTTTPAFGRPAMLTAQLRRAGEPTPLQGCTLFFESATSTGWAALATRVTIESGIATVSVIPAGNVAASYRVRYGGAGPLAESLSTSVTVRPIPRLSRSTSWSTIYRYRTYYAKGYVEPKHSSTDANKVRIMVYRRQSNGTYKYYKYFKASYSTYSLTKSRYAASVRLTSRGAYKLTAVHPADSRNAAATGSADYFVVK